MRWPHTLLPTLLVAPRPLITLTTMSAIATITSIPTIPAIPALAFSLHAPCVVLGFTIILLPALLVVIQLEDAIVIARALLSYELVSNVVFGEDQSGVLLQSVD